MQQYLVFFSIILWAEFQVASTGDTGPDLCLSVISDVLGSLSVQPYDAARSNVAKFFSKTVCSVASKTLGQRDGTCTSVTAIHLKSFEF
jgi:hypothetical protein